MKVVNIQRFCMHDGPGVRTTVFLKGCPLRCAWCHNAETQRPETEILFYESKCIQCGACTLCSAGTHIFDGKHSYCRSSCKSCGACAEVCPTGALELCGKEYAVGELLEIVERDRAFYGVSGGVTLSGGEPLLQYREAELFLQMCKEHHIHTAVETCGHFSPDILGDIVRWTDLFLWDVKDTDSGRHKRYTGVSNERILENLFLADEMGAVTQLRCILVKGINTNEEHYNRVFKIAYGLKNCEGIRLIPYHSYGGSKALALGRENNGNDDWIPGREIMLDAQKFFVENGMENADGLLMKK